MATFEYFSSLPTEIKFKVFKFLDKKDLCKCALVSKEFYQLTTDKTLLNSKNISREDIRDYKKINILHPWDISRLLKISLFPEKICAYDFFNCKCDINTKRFNKKWFGHKNRKSKCKDCPKIDKHFTLLYILTVSLQYIFFLSKSMGTVWENSETLTQAVISNFFSILTTIWIVTLWFQSKNWIISSHYQAIFIVIGCLSLASSFHIDFFGQVVSLLITLLMFFHLLKSKSDNGYKNNLLLEMLIVHCVVIVQWITYRLPSLILLIVTLLILPLTYRLVLVTMQTGDLLAMTFSFTFFNTIWMLLMAIIQHSEYKIGILIPNSFLHWSDMEYWTHCFLMPMVSVQILLHLDSSYQQAKMIRLNILRKYTPTYGYKIVFLSIMMLVLLTIFNIIESIIKIRSKVFVR